MSPQPARRSALTSVPPYDVGLVTRTASEVARGAVRLFLGMTGARLIGIAAMPIVTRLYGPEDFAQLALFVAVVSMLNPLVTLRYVAAIPLPTSGLMAINLAALSVALALVLLSLSTTLLYVLGPLLPTGTLDSYFWLVPVSLLCTSLYELASIWSTRRKAFKVMTRSTVLQAISGNLTKIGLGLLDVRPAGLLVGQIVAQSGGILTLLRDAWPEIRPLLAAISLRRMRRALVCYWRFPALSLPALLLAIGAEQAPVFFIAAQYDETLTGSFGLAMTVVALPVMLIAKSLSSAFYGNVAELGRRRASHIHDLSLTLLWRLLLVAVPLSLALFLLAESLFPMIFGVRWAMAGSVMSALAPYLLGTLIFTSINQVLNVFHRQDIKLGLDAQRAALVLLLFVSAYWTDAKFLTFVWVYSLVMLGHFAVSTAWILLFLRGRRTSGQTYR